MRIKSFLTLLCLINIDVNPVRASSPDENAHAPPGQPTVTNRIRITQSNMSVILQPEFESFIINGIHVSASKEKSPAIIFSDETNLCSFPIESNYRYSDPIYCRGCTNIFFLVQRYAAVGISNTLEFIELDFKYVVGFDLSSGLSNLGTPTPKIVLDQSLLRNLLLTRRAWVSKLREVSSDGKWIRMDIAVETPNRGPNVSYPIKDYWYSPSEMRFVPDIQTNGPNLDVPSNTLVAPTGKP